MKKINSVQSWLPYDTILENGIIKLKDNSYVKILKVKPINYNLKSNLEKEAILNSYKIFLKTCNFNIQILIQSNKEDLSEHISNIEKMNKNKKEYIINLSKNYINYIQNLNKEKKSSSKKFFLVLREFPENKKNINENNEALLCEKLKDNYFKVKECLYRCGNIVNETENSDEVIKILNSFFNTKIIFN